MSFRDTLYNWYKEYKRDLPWRDIDNAYYIWLSEVILQQTRINQGIDYYYAFIKTFPSIEELGMASEDRVLSLWQGLGYYSRARNLHQAAKDILHRHNGVFPNTYEQIISLKGVGEYTAAAIASFAYKLPYAAVDGNVYRVLSRVFGLSDFIDDSKGKKIFNELATNLLDKENPGKFNNALMDFGSLQCIPKSPNCISCPFRETCIAFNNNNVHLFPQKRGKIKVRTRFFYYFDFRFDDKLLLKKRLKGDIWEGLYDFFLLEKNDKVSIDKLLSELKDIVSLQTEIVKINKYYKTTHILSHQKIEAEFFQIELKDMVGLDGFMQVSLLNLSDYGISALLQKYMNN